MKNTYLYLCSILATLLLASCEFSDNVADSTTNSGDADFTTYVALGNSLTSGYQDGALYKSGQENSYPAMLAQQMHLNYKFNQPLMADNLGGIPMIGMANKRVLKITESGLLPVVAEGEGSSTLANLYEGKPFHNLGVPGAKLVHLLAKGYGNPAGLQNGTANPYFVRFASSPNASVLEDALAAKPTFFSLWIGNNDVLGYATSGGDESNPLTGESEFAQYYGMLVAQLTANGAKGVVANIPYVSTIPFFNTVPNDALKLDVATAQKLTQFFQGVSGAFAKILIAQGVPAEQAKALAAQYGITFSEGNNRFLVETEKSQRNPLGFRQMSEEELLVLTIDQAAMKKGYGSVSLTPEVVAVLQKAATGGQITLAEGQQVLAAITPIKDKDVLDVEELAEIKNATEAFNTTIKQVAKEYNLAFFDVNALMQSLSTEGLRVAGVDYNSTFVTGGVFSLDGVHPNQRGYAIVANGFVKAINEKYNATLAEVDPNGFEGIVFP